MNLYYSYLGRMLSGKTSFKREGYYLVYENRDKGFTYTKPEHIEVITSERFLEALIEGSKMIVNQFAESANNQDVYAFALFADEHHNLCMFTNTISQFERTAKKYKESGSTTDEHLLKYNPGDFKYQLWIEGSHEYIIDYFSSLNYADLHEEQEDTILEDREPILAYEAGIIAGGYQVLVVEAMRRLVQEDVFHPLNKTDDFIAYATIDNDCLDYSLLMRETINRDLFYRVFPEHEEKDHAFQLEMDKNKHLSAGEWLDYWLGEIHGEALTGISVSDYWKPEFEIFVQMEHLGQELAEECLHRLYRLVQLKSNEREDGREIEYYLEAMHFAGELTDQHKAAARKIANTILPIDEFNKYLYRELQEFAE
jgi:hypothetical protein